VAHGHDGAVSRARGDLQLRVWEAFLVYHQAVVPRRLEWTLQPLQEDAHYFKILGDMECAR